VAATMIAAGGVIAAAQSPQTPPAPPPTPPAAEVTEALTPPPLLAGLLRNKPDWRLLNPTTDLVGDYTIKQLEDLDRWPPWMEMDFDHDGKDDIAVVLVRKGSGGTEYTVAVGACQQVITRSTPDNIFCDGGVYPNFPGCVAVDSYAGVVVTVSTMPGGVTYNHTDCSLDQGVKFPKDALGVSNTLNGGGNPCGTNNNPSTIFANIAHGMELTFFFNTPTGHNCTFTQGYYKNHESYTASVLSSNAGTTYIDATGKLLIGPYALTAAQVDAILGADVGHGYNTGGVVFTKDQLSMIHQLITAELNIAGGAAPATIVAIVTAANNYAGATKTQLSNWTDALDDFNKGSNGPNHCK